MKRIRTPTIIQMEAVECGVACLSIVLAYFKRYLPLEILRVECGVSRDGSNLLNIKKAAEKYGLIATGLKLSVSELRSTSFPAILFWEFRHFVVLEGFKKDKVYINDPATGPKVISLKELEESYSGVMLSLEKGEDFKESTERPVSLAKQLYDRLKSVPHLLGFLIAIGLCLLLPGIAIPTLLRVFIDTFFSKNLLPWGGAFLGAVLLTALFSGALHWMRFYYLNRLNGKLSIQFSSHFLWHLLRLPMEFYSQRYSGEIAYRAGLNDLVINSLTGSILFSAIDLVLVIFYGALMFLYDWSIALIGVGGGICTLVVMRLVYRSRVNAYACLQQDIGKSIGESIGGLLNIEAIKAKGNESDFFSKWAGYNTRKLNAYQFIGKKDTILIAVPILFQMVASALLLGIGGLRILDGPLTVGMLMALQLLMTNFLQPIQRFVSLSQVIQDTKIQLDRLNDVLKNPTDPIYTPKNVHTTEKKKLEGRLEFKDVTFGYTRLSPPLIENLSFTIEPSQRLAFVGPTGSGKSTIAKLASGLFTPWSGQILYDGISFEEISRELLYHSIATVDQEIFIFAGTIRENITLWNSKVPEETLIASGRNAEIHEEIIAREGGYDAFLIEGGRNLSGGQRQRLEIARALLYNPSLLILDEATSALDSNTEKKISDQIKQRGCSALMIAQRLSTIQDCDEIIVLDQGKVVQRGNHEELKATPGIYQELIAASDFDES